MAKADVSRIKQLLVQVQKAACKQCQKKDECVGYVEAEKCKVHNLINEIYGLI